MEKTVIYVRWAARLTSIISIGLLSAFLIGECPDFARLSAQEWLGLALFPVGVGAGMVLGWWREGLGGLVTLASVAAFYLVQWLSSGKLPRGWAFLLFSAPGGLFLAAFLLKQIAGGRR